MHHLLYLVLVLLLFPFITASYLTINNKKPNSALLLVMVLFVTMAVLLDTFIDTHYLSEMQDRITVLEMNYENNKVPRLASETGSSSRADRLSLR